MSRLLVDLHPLVRQRAIALLEEALKRGHEVVITQTLRTIEEQEALYQQGRTTPGPIVTRARGGESYHNYRLAFDFAIDKKRGEGRQLTWDAKVSVDGDDIPDYVEVGEIGESLGLSWGGRWKKPDLPHFEYTFGLTIPQLKAGMRPPEWSDIA